MKLTGIGASEGVAVGPAFVPATGKPEPGRERITEDEVEAELQRFKAAAETVAANLSETGDRLRAAGSEEEAGIFDFHVEMAEDPELASAVEERVVNLESPEAAVLAVGEEYAAEYAAMDDEYMAARADDVRDVTGQISAQLIGRSISAFEALKTPSVVHSHSLAPSDTARIQRGMALGFVTAEGSKTSHVSIMARSMGIPAVVGVGPSLERVLGAETVAVDGGQGYAIADPDADTVAEFERMSGALAEERAALDEYRHIEASTSEGRRIEVAAKNVDTREHDIADSDDYFQYHGGMVATVRALTGRELEALELVDNREHPESTIPPRFGHHVLPAKQEPHEVLCRHRFNLASKPMLSVGMNPGEKSSGAELLRSVRRGEVPGLRQPGSRETVVDGILARGALPREKQPARRGVPGRLRSEHGRDEGRHAAPSIHS